MRKTVFSRLFSTGKTDNTMKKKLFKDCIGVMRAVHV